MLAQGAFTCKCMHAIGIPVRCDMHGVRNAQVVCAKSSNLTNLNLNLCPKHFPLQLIENFIACTGCLRFQKIFIISRLPVEILCFFFVHDTILFQLEISLYRALFSVRFLCAFNVRLASFWIPHFRRTSITCTFNFCDRGTRCRAVYTYRLWLSIKWRKRDKARNDLAWELTAWPRISSQRNGSLKTILSCVGLLWAYPAWELTRDRISFNFVG